MSHSQTSTCSLVTRTAIEYWEGVKSLFGCPREIWVSYVLNVLDSIGYFSTVLLLMPFLINDMGLSDVRAGTVYGLFSAGMSLLMLFVGFIADSYGIKRAFMIGLVISLLARFGITFSTSTHIVFPSLFLLSLGFAFMTPLLPSSMKLYATRKAHKHAFAWFYVVMNVGAMIAGLMLDGLRELFTQSYSYQILGINLQLSSIQMIFLFSLGATVLSLLLVIFLIRHKIPREAFKEAPDIDPTAKKEIVQADEKKSFFRIMFEVGREKQFWIFMLFILLLVLVKMIFQYNHALYPVYMERIGLINWTGKLYSINPIIIIFLVPVITAMTGKMKSYTVILVGTFVSACSVFFLSMGKAILWIMLFQVMLSFGEALWSPRLYDYTASIAPKGKESSYMAMSQVPMFFAKVAAGPLSGVLLANLCPAQGERNTELMWAIVGLSTLVSPIILLLGKRWLDVERGR